jgi:hypothetical protein
MKWWIYCYEHCPSELLLRSQSYYTQYVMGVSIMQKHEENEQVCSSQLTFQDVIQSNRQYAHQMEQWRFK